MRFELLAVVALLASCSGDDKAGTAPTEAKPTDQPIRFVVTDAGMPGTTGVDPSAVRVDHGAGERPTPAQPLPGRERRAIDVTLRSSPPGARVAVDGTEIGTAPTFWSGYADGRQHEFTFQLPRHAITRYRFVPVSSGVIHARLEPIAEERDAGVAPPPEVVPKPSPSAVTPPTPPPTLVTPDAAIAPPPPMQPAQGSAVPAPSSGPGPQP